MKTIEQTVTETILIWRSYWTPPTTDNLAMVRAWVGALGLHGITGEEFERAMPEIIKLQFWPKPGEVERIVKTQRQHDWSNRLANYAECLDQEGRSLLAPRNCITDGRLDASGNGNGRALPEIQSVPALSVREILDAMTNEEAKTIFIALVGPEAINGGE